MRIHKVKLTAPKQLPEYCRIVPQFLNLYNHPHHLRAGEICHIQKFECYTNDDYHLFLSPLRGPQDEGVYIKIPCRYINFNLTEEEIEIGKKLMETFWERDHYPTWAM